MSSPINFLRGGVREVEVVPGTVGLPSGDLQRRVVGVLSELEGGELVKVLTRSMEHLGFEFCDMLARGLILKFNCVAKFVKPLYPLLLSRLFAMPGLHLGGMVIILPHTVG